MKEIIIRKATKDDASLIAQVVAMAIGDEDCLKFYCGDNYLSVLEELAVLENSQYSYNNAFVAEIEGETAGAVVGYDGAKLHSLREVTQDVISKYISKRHNMEDETDASEFYLDSLGVLPEYRGRGIATKLISAIKERAFHECNKPLGLLVDFENPDAERLYQSLGFERVEVKDFLGHKMWHMVL